jgi:hypothetical protein
MYVPQSLWPKIKDRVSVLFSVHCSFDFEFHAQHFRWWKSRRVLWLVSPMTHLLS